MPLQIIRQDILKIKCDAIVNPTNCNLSPSGGLDLSLHKAAGDELLSACKKIGGIKVGEAVITQGYKLPAKHVIHTAGPVWGGGENGEETLLRSCYRNALKLAEENKCESVAFPLISSGTYGYPKDEVLKVAIDTISSFLLKNDMMAYLVVYDKTAYKFSEKLFLSIESYIDDNYVKEHSDFYRSSARRTRYDGDFSIYPNDSMSVSMPKAVESEICDKCSVGGDDELDIDSYIKLDESFSVKLLKLIDLKGMSDVECYKKANVSKQTWYKIMNEKHYKPNKKTAISFAVALELTLEETQSLLNSVGFVLSKSSLFDVIIMYCLEHNIYDVLEIDSILFKYDQETLYSKL